MRLWLADHVRRFAAYLAAVARGFIVHDGLQSAGYIAFSAFIGLLPFLSFLMSLGSFVGREEAAERFLDLFAEIVPAEVAAGLETQLQDLVETPRGGLLTVSFVVTLWIASSGVEALRQALNRAYALSRTTALWRRRLQDLAFVIIGAAAILGAMAGLLAAPLAESLLSQETAAASIAPWLPLRLVIIGVVTLLVVSMFYWWLPSVRLHWPGVLPGSVLCTALWGAGSAVFSAYLTHVADYSLVYGSLSGLIVVLVFFYFLGFAFVLGGEFNAELYRRRVARRSAAPAPQ